MSELTNDKTSEQVISPSKEKLAGRKYEIAKGILIAATLIMVLPSVLSLFSTSVLPLLLTGGEYVSLVIGTFGLYVGGNVFQKKILNDTSSPEVVSRD